MLVLSGSLLICIRRFDNLRGGTICMLAAKSRYRCASAISDYRCTTDMRNRCDVCVSAYNCYVMCDCRCDGLVERESDQVGAEHWPQGVCQQSGGVGCTWCSDSSWCNIWLHKHGTGLANSPTKYTGESEQVIIYCVSGCTLHQS